MNIELMKQTIAHITANGKGILAADESNSTAGKRLASIGGENTEDNRRSMREMFFTAENVETYIGGVILFDETLRQRASTGEEFRTMLINKGMIPGIKVDEGLDAFGEQGEQITKGLEGLPARLPEYFNLGARFAKWRAVYTITDALPTTALFEEAANRLAKYAKLCQQNNIVPIVEPEVLMDHAVNNTHTAQRAYEVTSAAHVALFKALKAEGVVLEAVMLKPSMIVAGKKCANQPSVEEVAELTYTCLSETVPAEVGAVVFLSGGQSDAQATAHLDAINKIADGKSPWPMTYSYGRALQGAALQAWAMDAENILSAQEVFIIRCKENTAAALGRL